MADIVTLPDISDIVDEMANSLGVQCALVSRGGVVAYEVPDGADIPAVQAWLDDPARQSEALTRYRKRFKEASIEHAAVSWREARGDENRVVIEFASAVASWISVSVALGNTLTAEQTALAQWAHDVLESVEPWAQAAYDAEQRAATDTNLQDLYNHGTKPGNAPEFVGVGGNGQR